MTKPRTFFAMYYVYLLQSKEKIDKFYLGSTNDLKRRLKEHNDKKCISSKAYASWGLIYCEAFNSEKDARNREKALKHHGKGMSELKRRLKNGIRN
ncbi:MAG: GIY-YIG nuclease family protein [Candidatus Zapsychrus exili]|nr:GIY-YIG nuclease family protein [Candidatus Zapsychrus exili]